MSQQRILPVMMGFLCWILCIFLSLAQAQNLNTARFEECKGLTEETLREDLNQLTQDLLRGEIINLDIDALVEREWQDLNMDATIEDLVSDAVDQVRQETTYLERLWSGWSQAKAQDLAERIANDSFGSDIFLERIEDLAGETGIAISDQFTVVTESAASQAVLCAQEFISGNYGDTVQEAYTRGVVEEAATVDTTEGINTNITPNPITGRTALGVATIIGGYVARGVMRQLSQQVSRRVAGRIAGRVAGRVGSSVVPVVGWVVGLGLIAWDLVEGNDGALPTIEKALTDPEVSAEIQSEIATAIKEELGAISAEAGRTIADTVYDQWRDFEFKFGRVLQLAEDNPEFQAFLNRLTSEYFFQLAEVADILDNEMLFAALESGNLRRVVQLPIDSIDILRATRSIEQVLAWDGVARTALNLARVAEYEVYRYKAPDEFTPETLERLLSSRDQDTITTLAQLDRTEMDALLSHISLQSLGSITNHTDTEGLQELAQYLEELDPASGDEMVKIWAQEPEYIPRFQEPFTHRTIVTSRDPLAAIRFISTDTTPFSFYRDVPQLLSGNIPWPLFMSKYARGQMIIYTVITVIVLLLLLSAVFQRLFGGRRRRKRR